MPTGNDDVAGYIKVIERLKDLNFIDIFDPQIMSGYEPVSQVIWWVAMNIGLSINQVIFLQLFTWVIVLIMLAHHVSKRFSVFILMIGMGLYAEIIPLQFHSLYRSSWAFMFISLSIIYAKKNPINGLTILAFFSHFASGIIIFFKLIFERNIFNRYIFILLLLFTLIFIKMDLLSGIFSKLTHYHSSYVHSYNLDIVKSQLLGIVTLLLFYNFTSKNPTQKYMFYSALSIYIFTFIPFISWISMRLFVLVAPLAFMVCAPVRNKYVLYGAVFLSLFRFVLSISSEHGLYNMWGTDFFISLDRVFGVL